MRTTLTLDPDTVAMLRRLMSDRGMTFKEAVNYAIRAGLGASGRPTQRFETPTFAMGEPAVPLTKALRLAGELEDEHLIDRLAVRK